MNSPRRWRSARRAVVDQARHVFDAVDPFEKQLRVGNNRSDMILIVPTPTMRWSESLRESHIVHVDHFDAVGHPAQQARLVDKPLRCQLVVDAQLQVHHVQANAAQA